MLLSFLERDYDKRSTRDRENCTVFVADLPEGTKEDELKALFKDVRPVPIRSSLMKSLISSSVERYVKSR